MLQIAPHFKDISDIEQTYLGHLETAGEMFEKFFETMNVSARFTIMDRGDRGYPLLIITAGDSPFEQVKACVQKFGDLPCPIAKGVMFHEISCEVEESDSIPAAIAMNAGKDIVFSFARELVKQVSTPEHAPALQQG